MAALEGTGKLLLVFGGIIALLGLVTLFTGRIPFLGRLPGDIVLQRGNFTLYVPLVTMLLLSIGLTVLLNVVFRLFR